jgi:hypothetical protein
MPLEHVMGKARTTFQRRMADGVGLLLFVVFLPLIVVLIATYLLAGVFLHVAAWCCWCSRGRYVLFVYSESPTWHDYVLGHILPRLGDKAIVLNWSRRSRWRRTLSVLAFRYFGGYREFNPMAVVFCPFRLAKVFRFYEPFHEFKHGNPEAVIRMESDLYRLIDNAGRSRAA